MNNIKYKCQHCNNEDSGYCIDLKLKCGNCDKIIKEMTKEETQELYKKLMELVSKGGQNG